MNSQWFAVDLLVGLPGQASTVQGVRFVAERDGWEKRKAAFGKGYEYHITSLPPETRRALNIRAAKARAREQLDKGLVIRPRNATDSETLWKRLEQVPFSMQDKAKFKLKVLVEFMELRDCGMSVPDAEQQIRDDYGVSRATLHRWKKAVKEVHRGDWLPMLIDDYKGNQTSAECTPDAWEFFKADYLRLERPTAADCYRRLAMAAKANGWVIPTKRTMTTWSKRRIPATTRVLLREGELALMKRYPALDRTVRDLHALEWINGDGYQHNVFVAWPDGETVRPKVWYWQDVYSRKILAYRVDVTEHTDQIRLSFGDVVEQYGIPEHVTIDNTRAAANKWMSGGVKTRYRFKVKEDDPLGLFPQLGVVVHWTSVNVGKGHGQAKPIERAFGVGGLGEWIDKHPAFAGAWTGNNPNAKPENYASHAVALDLFLTTLNAGIIEWNQRTERRTEACAGVKSFDQAFNDSYQQSVIRTPSESQRRLWMLQAESVQVRKDGTFTMDAGAKTGEGRNRYFAPELQALGEERHKIVVRFDPQSLHDEVHCYTLKGLYIAPARLWDAAGFGDTEISRLYNKHRRQFIKSQKAAAKAMRQMDTAEMLSRLPAPEQPKPTAPGASRIVRPARPIEVPAAMAADNERQQTAQDQLVAEAQEALKVIQAEFAQQSDPEPQIPEDLAERYSYWRAVDGKVKAGESLSTELMSWHQSYPGSADYEAGLVLAELREQRA